MHNMNKKQKQSST